jgi:hypothetical protein
MKGHPGLLLRLHDCLDGFMGIVLEALRVEGFEVEHWNFRVFGVEERGILKEDQSKPQQHREELTEGNVCGEL